MIRQGSRDPEHHTMDTPLRSGAGLTDLSVEVGYGELGLEEVLPRSVPSGLHRLLKQH